MLEIRGKYNTAIVYTDQIEPTAVGQLTVLCSQPFIEGCTLRIMPDVHAGAGCVVGTTLTIKDKIVPNLVGVDISCFTGDTRIPLVGEFATPTLYELEKRTSPFWVYTVNNDGIIVTSQAICKKTKINA